MFAQLCVFIFFSLSLSRLKSDAYHRKTATILNGHNQKAPCSRQHRNDMIKTRNRIMLNWCERETNWVLNSIRFEFSSLLLALLLMLFYQLNRWKITKSKKYAFFTWTPSNVIWMKWKQHSQHSTHAHNEWAISNFGIILQTKAAATIRGYTFSHSIPILFFIQSIYSWTFRLWSWETETSMQRGGWCISTCELMRTEPMSGH